MSDSVLLERIAARRAELDLLEEELVKQLADVRVEREELVVAERVVQRIGEQGFGEYLSLAPPPEDQVGGRPVLLIPTRAVGGGPDALPADYPRILSIVRSGKHKRHGLHFLALTDEKGRLIWISAARPGRTHDITAARHDHIVDHLKAAGLGALADLGFLGLDKDGDDQVVVTGYKATRARELATDQKTANRIIAAGRAPVEHGFAHLKTWCVLTKLRTDKDDDIPHKMPR